MLQDRQKLYTRNDALTPVVASVLLLLMVAGCCTAVGIVMFQQMNTAGSDAPDVRIHTSAESRYHLYHAGDEPLPRSSLILYDANNVDILSKTSINGNADWTVWNSGEYLKSSRALYNILLVWKNRNGDEIILYRNGNTGLSPVEDAVPN
ncbi:MAG: hypothetical protein MJ014_04440 [Methanocorpusculum sp.]|nr:hypothetical protein [Methanocorpusculum sp.]